MGNDLKHKILIHDRIVPPKEIENKPSVNSCPRCGLVNPIENKYCPNCSYPLTPYAYEEIKQDEEIRFKKIEENYSMEVVEMKQQIQMLAAANVVAPIAEVMPMNPVLVILIEFATERRPPLSLVSPPVILSVFSPKFLIASKTY